MARLLLLRHAQSTWNAEARWQGWADPRLSDVGREQSTAMVVWLGDLGVAFERVVSSDLRRSIETAGIVAEGLGLGTPAVEPQLRERDVGDWSGRTTEEIELIWPGAIAAWRAGRLDRPPGGEHEPSFRGRVVAAVERLAGTEGGPILVITHGGVIRSLDRHLGGEGRTTGNLSGRWVEASPSGLAGGEHVALPSAGEERITSAL